jgi:hypothetical protein
MFSKQCQHLQALVEWNLLRVAAIRDRFTLIVHQLDVPKCFVGNILRKYPTNLRKKEKEEGEEYMRRVLIRCTFTTATHTHTHTHMASSTTGDNRGGKGSV